ncbi:hypothetical protein E1B28_000475 [Marasmius oreades]|uniref:U3 small nucleolar RNA-associated protein 10 n=1 Tax=Marasmius oreades TaxID=181124 RepID=A0A9P7V1H7_9AGAR|nr:uncharacterized protein E1B28_000475 [Marasmius oreades]KAG7098539.1 hypothetical protein E1B28_000475 [Marasmius oreades]
MVSSLAAQLTQNASLNASLLVDRTLRKPTESYLFTGKDADQYDLDSVYALGANGFIQLVSLDPGLGQYESALFSYTAKSIDRTLLTAAANSQLDTSIRSFLLALGPYLLEVPTGKVIEWLVRRFRVNEFNVEALISVFLPYHETPHFAKMNTILHVKKNTTWSFLLPFKSAAQSVPRIALVTEMKKNSEVARHISSLLPNAIKEGYSHRTLVAFNAATLHDFIIHSDTLEESCIAYLLPALVEPLQTGSPKDAILGSYILISTLSQKCKVTPAALKALVVSMISCAHEVGVTQVVNALISVCEAQDVLEELPNHTVKSFLRLKGINEEVERAMSWEGSEKLIVPLVSGIGRRLKDDTAVGFVETVISSPVIPTLVIRHLTKILLTQAVTADPSSASDLVDVLNMLLYNILQRHPVLFRELIDEMSQAGDEGTKHRFEQLSINLSMGYASSKSGGIENVDDIVATSNADDQIRATAVKNLLEKSESLESRDGEESLHAALLARVQDTSQSVLEILYTNNPPLFLRVAAKNPQIFLDSLDVALTSFIAKPRRAILKLHLGFLLEHFFPKVDGNDHIVEGAFHRFIFPFLLYSKPRQHTADLVWDALDHYLSRAKGPSSLKELLKGCDEVRKLHVQEDPIERMAKINQSLAARIAENVLASNEYPHHLDEVVNKLTDENSHARVFGYLIARALVTRLSGEHQVAAADRILSAINLEQVAASEDASDDVIEILKKVDHIIVLKPNSKNTACWVQVSTINTLSQILPPEGLSVDFISSSLQRNPDDRGYHYAKVMRHIYKICNSLSPALKKHLLCKVFLSLKDDALLFFAGIFSSKCYDSERDDLVKNQMKASALHYASAFVEAAEDSEEAGIDFQTIVPCLLVALQDKALEVRKGATELLARIKRSTKKKFGSVYAFDIVYGDNKHDIQYLSQEDFKKYMMSLLNHIEHFLHDPHYVRVFHKDHLARSSSNPKKEANYRHRVLCYILSHITASTEASAQLTLLSTIQDVSDKSKVEALLPIIQQITSISESASRHFGSYRDEIVRLTTSAFDTSVTDELNEKPLLWDTYLAIVQTSVKTASMREVITARITSIFPKLQQQRKVELCLKLVELGSGEGSNIQTYVKNLLSIMLYESVIVIQLLNSLRMEVVDGPRSSKRAKLAEPCEPEDLLLRLGLLAEVLGSVSLPSSLDLISHLLETLSRVMQSTPSVNTDVIFIEQSLMSAIDNVAGKVKETNRAPNAIRLDILVELIRVTENPQTFQQALLLIANLARFAPDSVLHNIMPVFTFMGSNVFHRDDAYSFAVVQKTIDNIVPVMVSSLKKTNNARLDLYIASRDFLRVFTDAANHIPRHRRTNFFAHLVDVLGPGDFLAPVCLLLVEKSTNRIIRQNTDDSQTALAPPTSLIHHYSAPLQISALVEMLHESRRLASRANGVDSSQPTLLDDSLPEESTISPTTMSKRRAQAIITFVGHATKVFPSAKETKASSSESPPSLSNLVSLFISLATMKSKESAPDLRIDEIVRSARLALSKVLSIVPARDFVGAILSMLGSGDGSVQAGALDLLYSRLPKISTSVRQEVVPSIVKIVESVQTILSHRPEKAAIFSALKAIEAIGSTMSQGEESCLTNLISSMIVLIKDRELGTSAMSALAPLPSKLGPRLIPFFREIVSQAVVILPEADQDLSSSTIKVIHGFLMSIPTLWSSVELNLVLKLSLDYKVSPHSQEGIAMLVKTITKRALSKVLLPTICELWPSLERSSQPVSLNGYFDITRRSIRSAGRTEVQEHLRALFKVFLGAFEAVKALPLERDNAKARAILSFVELVVKLNESAFRPLFRRLHDWTFVEGNDTSRSVTFCQIYIGLLDYFKNLMNPYMTLVITPLVEIMKDHITSTSTNKELLTVVLETFAKSISYDDGGYWRDEKIRQVTPSLISLIPICAQLNISEGKAYLQDSLTSTAEHVLDDTLLKTINLDILMHTRSEDASTRIFALSCSEALWRVHGGKLLGFVAETATFIAECCEDEHDTVVKESFKLKDAVEAVAGSINGM